MKFPGIEPGQHNGSAPEGQHGVDANAQSEAMKDGHHGKHPVTGLQASAAVDALQSQCIEIQIRQQDALGLAGGAAGVKHCRPVCAGSRICYRCSRLLHQLFPVHTGVPDFPGANPVCHPQGQGHKAVRRSENHPIRRQTCQLFRNGVQRQGYSAAAELQSVFDFTPGGKGMNHVCNSAQLVYGIKPNDRLGNVRQDHGHAVAFPDL